MLARYALAALLGVACGCSNEPAVAPVAVKPQVAPPKQSAATATATPAKASGESPDDDKPATIDPTTLLAASQPAEGYTAPFPERGDLFAPPKQAARPQRSEGNESTDSVVLMGFAKLDNLKVVLAIDGVVSPVEPGGEVNGLRVISADPPKAVLQRGRSRWTASIE
jgi:hypothetical protein